MDHAIGVRARALIVGSIVAVVAVLAGCGGAAPSTPAPQATTSPSTAASLAAVPSPSVEAASPSPTKFKCPYPVNACLGRLAAGTYSTSYFEPAITYTVPDQWANWEDSLGEFLLVAPGFTLGGVDGDTSDYVGAYPSITAPNGCDPGSAPGVGTKPADLNAYYLHHPGLTVTSKPITISGRAGFALDIVMKASWTTPCPYSNGSPLVPLTHGVDTSSGVEHNIGAGRHWRLYLLANGAGTMAIECVDIKAGGANLPTYETVAETMTFAP